MLFAIDTYSSSETKEVLAAYFDSHSLGRRDRHRFKCMACNEYVVFRKGTKRISYFAHLKKGEGTPDCEKRVQSRYTSLLQTNGIPLYLEERMEGIYKLKIGLPGIPSIVLDYLESKNAKVIIKAGSRKSTYPISRSHFRPDVTNYFDLNYLPLCGESYQVKWKPTSCRELSYFWTNFAKGFKNNRAFFSSKGQKRRLDDGDFIYTKDKYFLAAFSFIPSFEEVKYQKVGTLCLFNDTFNIYEIWVETSTNTTASKYQELRTYFFQEFGLRLVDKNIKILPLWPPIAKQNNVAIAQTDKQLVLITGLCKKAQASLGTDLLSSSETLREEFVEEQLLRLDLSQFERSISLIQEDSEIKVSFRMKKLESKAESGYYFLNGKGSRRFSFENCVFPFRDFEQVETHQRLSLVFQKEKGTYKALDINCKRMDLSSLFPLSCKIFQVIEGSIIRAFEDFNEIQNPSANVFFRKGKKSRLQVLPAQLRSVHHRILLKGPKEEIKQFQQIIKTRRVSKATLKELMRLSYP